MKPKHRGKHVWRELSKNLPARLCRIGTERKRFYVNSAQTQSIVSADFAKRTEHDNTISRCSLSPYGLLPCGNAQLAKSTLVQQSNKTRARERESLLPIAASRVAVKGRPKNKSELVHSRLKMLERKIGLALCTVNSWQNERTSRRREGSTLQEKKPSRWSPLIICTPHALSGPFEPLH